jgi:hypothetical protein
LLHPGIKSVVWRKRMGFAVVSRAVARLWE